MKLPNILRQLKMTYKLKALNYHHKVTLPKMEKQPTMFKLLRMVKYREMLKPSMMGKPLKTVMKRKLGKS